MNPPRPIDLTMFAIALAWLAIALFVLACHIYILTRGQSLLGKLLYTIGVILLASLPAAMAFDFAITGWYGGKPDHAASTDGQFYVRERVRLTPVSAEEFHWLDRMHAQRNWFVKPCLAGAGCIALGRLIPPRSQARTDPATA